jgi:hypothetical protein
MRFGAKEGLNNSFNRGSATGKTQIPCGNEKRLLLQRPTFPCPSRQLVAWLPLVACLR